MTDPVVTPAHGPRITDAVIETAILDLLAEREEIYPSFLVDELRGRHPALPPQAIRRVLERLWFERRVARLWHRYMLARDVDAVRTKWLATIDCRRAETERMDARPDAFAESCAILKGWDGWVIKGEMA